MGAHKDSGWDPRPQELTKRRGVLEESRDRPRSPSGGERRPSAESAGALGRHSCGEGRAVTTSVSWAEARDVARG